MKFAATLTLIGLAGCGAKVQFEQDGAGGEGPQDTTSNGGSPPVVGGSAQGGEGPGEGGAGGESIPTVEDRTGLIRACARVVACGGHRPSLPTSTEASLPNFFETLSGCLDVMSRGAYYRDFFSTDGGPDLQVGARAIECAESSSCDEFRACYGGDWIHQSRCRYDSSCENNSIVHPIAGAFDCGAIGATCEEDDGLYACCTVSEPCGACSDGHAIICGGVPAMGLQMSALQHCEEPELQCGAFNQYSSCVGTGAPCELSSCDGTTLHACVGGFEATFDCTATASRRGCLTFADGEVSRCEASATDCDALHDSTTCASDDRVLLCVDGKVEQYACADAGLSICVEGNDTAWCE